VYFLFGYFILDKQESISTKSEKDCPKVALTPIYLLLCLPLIYASKKQCSKTLSGTAFQSIFFDVVAKRLIMKSNIAYPKFWLHPNGSLRRKSER
jgi:hypothetical protein